MDDFWQHSLPAPLAAMVGGASWRPVTIGMSDSAVFQLTMPGQIERYLKIAPRDAEFPLEPESARIQWLQERLPVPQGVWYGADAEREYLVMTAVPGVMACDPQLAGDMGRVTRLLAAGLRMVHAVPIADCPFVMDLDTRLAEAGARVAAGLVDVAQFDMANGARTPEEVYAELLATRPAEEDLVFTHGDYCLPNVLIDGDEIGGFIDLGRAGIADRWMDLALAARSLAFNGGAAWVPLLFAAYGVAPDAAMVGYYQLLDELF